MRFLLLSVAFLIPETTNGRQLVFVSDAPVSGGNVALGPTAASLAPVPLRYPTLVWPVGPELGDRTFLSNYVDDDQGDPSVTDYMGGNDHLYDDHRGTDIAIYNFRLMDRGVPILAAAGGRVIATTYHFGDRNTTTPYPDGGNGLSVEHDDGTRAFYWHIRANSVMVEPGERVEAGQPLAFVGSSGWTPIPHLHFELSGARDPWNGSYNPLPSLWTDQPAYVGDAPLWVMDMDVFTLEAVGGALSGLTDSAVKERVSTPAVAGSDEGTIYAWVQVQGNRGDIFRLELVRPDGSIAHAENQGLSSKRRYGWYAFALPLSGEVDEGMWGLRAKEGDRLLMERTFEVGTGTAYPPRFRPVSGRSVRMTGTRHEAQLWAAPPGGSVAFHLVDPPAGVHLDGDRLVLDGASDQPYRSRHFQVVATDGEARTDTLWYHLVDPAKPFNPAAVDVFTPGTPELPIGLTLDQNHPNPTGDTTTIAFDLDAWGQVHLGLFDLLGREVITLVDEPRSAGTHRVEFSTRALSVGRYAYRLTTAAGVVTRQMIVMR